MTEKKRLWGILGFCGLVVGLGAYVYALPYLTAARLRDSIRHARTEDLRDLVDFNALRASVKEQVNDSMAEAMLGGSDANALSVAAGSLGVAMIDKLIDAVVTPTGIIRMLSATPHAGTAVGSLNAVSVEATKSDISLGYMGPSKFEISVPSKNGSTTKWILCREGLTWRLSAVTIPRSQLLGLLPSGMRASIARRETEEASSNINHIFKGLAAFHASEKARTGDPRAQGALGLRLAVTPSTPICGDQPREWTDKDKQRWSAIGFVPDRPARYTYTYAPARELGFDEAGTSLIRATGDLDCDGVYSTFELAVGEDKSGVLFHAKGFYIVDETE